MVSRVSLLLAISGTGAIAVPILPFDSRIADPSPTTNTDVVSGTIRGDDCSALTSPDVAGTCPIVEGQGFTVEAFLAVEAGADCCGLDRCTRCLIRYVIQFDDPFAELPIAKASAGPDYYVHGH
jgi:hypothetical protein